MKNGILFTGAISAALAVIIGAFGAHALKPYLDAYSLGVFNTANEYHVYHSLGLLVIGILALLRPDWRLLKPAALFMGCGILIFSGSLYLLAASGIRWLGAITPLGGLAFIVSWVMVAVCVYRNE